MTNHPNRSQQKLPSDVYYTRRNGGMYVRWNGRPEGQISYTYSRSTAYGVEDETDDLGWALTPYQGADARCRSPEAIRLAAEYSR